MNNTSIKDWLSLISSDNNIPPDTLDIGMIELMHPDCGENIVFMKIPPNKIPFHYPCKISELRKYLPGVAEFLMQDGYVTVNAFCKTRW